ncbi:Hpt domain-containing protein [Paraglaciecola aquimarina]|uniref:Hpt domain-containing protein n=1 Tax=Paraglaciecola algarum TaxID=3050085 RepID=A0ABS9DCG3_9ALTE|nr:Hpt domain-containing protein [Paraglaciecola sp. G1-23]MCF2950434.1 Hpt domain-containing protein [Paraglaciecola sp. G1-23]
MTEHELATFDQEFALSQFSGNESILIKILDKFVSQNESFNQQLMDSLQLTDLSTAKIQVHTLKGVTGNLGMKALHHACKDIEHNLEQLAADLPTNPEALNQFMQLVDKTVLTAKNYGVAEEPVKTQMDSSVQPAEPTSEKEKLIAALKRNEFLSDAKLTQYLDKIELSTEDKEQLIKSIDDFDYSKAISLLN